jgi:IS5 family transposase
MAGQAGLFDWERRYAALSAAGDPLERLALVIDFELFRTELEAALARSDRAKGGRPPYDAVLMFKVLVLQTLYTRSDDQTEYQIRDRLSFMRFLGLALEDRVPDAKTIWLCREQLTQAGAIERLFASFDAVLPQAGYLAMAGQIVDATVVEARRPRLTRTKRRRSRPARCPRPGPGPSDRRHGFIRSSTVTDAAAYDGRQLRRLLDPDNTASGVWADTAYRSAANVALLVRRGLVPQFQRAKPRGRAMPPHITRGNARRARVRVAIEHVFAAQKCRLGLLIRSVGLARATTKLGLANLVTNMRRLAWFELRPQPASSA